MKRLFLLAMVALMGTTAFAQRDYNKWSIEGGIGFNKAWRDYTPGYYTNTPSWITGDVGVRYMWSQRFGMKLDYGFNNITPGDGSKDFDADYQRINIQAVANMGRILRFEEWTKTIGLLVHAGPGVGFLHSDAFDGSDAQINLVSGATLQFRLSKRVALNLDGSAVLPFDKIDRSWDGHGASPEVGVMFNGTLGLSVYLGKHEAHSDWYLEEQNAMAEMLEKYEALSEKVENYRNEAAKASAVAAAQENINKVASDVEDLKNAKAAADYDEFIKALTEQGFVSAFFSYDSSTVAASSISNINFLKTYLENNPNATVEVRGYADEKGAANYNQELSEKRAESAAKLLIEAGISESRISTVGMGVDSSVDINSANARQLARRASFIIK
ncbi:MAG: OmpA family protein [Mangrovibacterium sp.]